MEENLRKHVLNEYANPVKLEMEGNPTLHTDAIEISDPNEFNLQLEGPTILTETIEMSDPDEFVMKGPTYLTRSIEESDPDEFQACGFRMYEVTRIELSDEDEFLFM